MSSPGELARLERVIDTSGVCPTVEARLPVGIRRRQLPVRTLLLGMLLVALDGRPGHLRRVHHALITLPEREQRRLGVIAPAKTGPHQLTYRQVEYTFRRVTRALSKPTPDGAPSELLADVLDRLLEASVQVCGTPASGSLVVDWSALEAWARPPSKDGIRPSHDPEAAWGHRTVTHPGETETFFGYYLQAPTIVPEERVTSHDADGYRRVACPATTGKLRCPLRPQSLTLPYDRPTIHQPPEHPPVCCTQKTITEPPSVNAKTAQKHDYPSTAHRRSYQRRTAAERTFATTDRASTDLSRGSCRLTSLTPIALFTATTFAAQPPHRRRIHHPPGREPAPRRPRPPAQTTQTPPPDRQGPDQRGPRAALNARHRQRRPDHTAPRETTIPTPQTHPTADRNPSLNTTDGHPSGPTSTPQRPSRRGRFRPPQT